MLGQVWSKADCNGIRELGFAGGVGSVFAVTGQDINDSDVLGVVTARSQLRIENPITRVA